MTKRKLPIIDHAQIASVMVAYRARAGLSQREFAAILHTSPGTVGDMESGRPRSRRVAAMALKLMEQE